MSSGKLLSTLLRSSSSVTSTPSLTTLSKGIAAHSFAPRALSIGGSSSSSRSKYFATDAASASVPAPASAPASSSSDPPSPPPFRKILIANRGEIACRILRTARAHAIATVGIYSTADAKSAHVSLADEAVCIGPPASSESYLDIDKVCRAIEETGAEGVHPGYGFLSENARFAERVEGMDVNENVNANANVNENVNENVTAKEAGKDTTATTTTTQKKKVKFIGPSAHAIKSLGDKIQSKLIAEAAGVSTIPGFNGVVSSPDHAVEIAQEIGYPVMIKASSGGGGKGMRICYDAAQVREGYRLGSAEAKSFFGDDRLLVEKYVEDPHHIEIQVLSGRNPATGELDILCFAERECSIQRRNQKVVEESPSPHLLPSTRRRMIRQVKSLVRNVDYESAGTVEFLVDKHQNFYFLEMNTRLQVEHPVTEMISGDGYESGNYVDLVHGMLEVAAGRGIPKKYLDLVDRSNEEEEANDGGEGANVRYTGHAIEARIYAEDPFRGFLPSTGPLVKYVEPPPSVEEDSCTIRIDAGVVPGTNVSPFYDPILSKVIAYSPLSRGHAIRGLGSALDQYLLKGVQHNVPFVRDLLRNRDFVKGYTPTSFIGEHYPDGFSGGRLSKKETAEFAVIAREIGRKRGLLMKGPPLALDMGSRSHNGDDDDDEEEEVVVCMGGIFGDIYRVRSKFNDDGSVAANVTKMPKNRGSLDAGSEPEEVEEETHAITLSSMVYDPADDFAKVVVSGENRALQVHGEDETGLLKLTMYGSDADVLVMSPGEYRLACHMNEPKPKDLGNFVMSPMPGTLISFGVEEGDVVEMGQELCVVEAMKMQNVIRSHKAGAKVGKLHGVVGASLRADEVLIEFEQLESA